MDELGAVGGEVRVAVAMALSSRIHLPLTVNHRLKRQWQRQHPLSLTLQACDLPLCLVPCLKEGHVFRAEQKGYLQSGVVVPRLNPLDWVEFEAFPGPQQVQHPIFFSVLAVVGAGGGQ